MKELKGVLGQNGAVCGPFLLSGNFNFSLRGTWEGTIELQRSFDNGASWGTCASYTANKEDTGFEPEGALYRAIVTAYTSGNAETRFGQ